MRKKIPVLLITALLNIGYLFGQTTASFTAPDTVCVNAPVNVVNTSAGASSYYWNFCTGNLHQPPQGMNVGNIGNAMDGPVYIDYVEQNGNYYAFVTDNHVRNLYRLDFGNSLLNTPTLVNLGNAGGVIPQAAEGIQVVKNEGKWYAIIVGGHLNGGVPSTIVKLDFGPDITNTNPIGTDWGNIGNLAYPHDLYLFEESGQWYGFTTNSDNNTITRFSFGASFDNTPTGINLGNLGNMLGPTGIQAINHNGNWHVFVTNANNSTITRLDFGNSLLNTPTPVNLGNIGNTMHTCWDIYIMKFCGEILGYVINADPNYHDIVKLDFHNDLGSVPTGVSFGNIGNLSFPHAISKMFRDGADLYAFVPNVNNSSLTRLRFAGCNNSSIPDFNGHTPPTIQYNQPGTYNITLTVDEGLPTQTSYCKQVVVVQMEQRPTDTLRTCSGDSIKIGSSYPQASWLWNTGAITDSVYAYPGNTYWVTTTKYGCSSTDTFRTTSTRQLMDFAFVQAPCNPLSVEFASTGTANTDPHWSLGDGNTVSGQLAISHLYAGTGDYEVSFSVQDGSCRDTLTKLIPVRIQFDDLITVQDTVICYGGTKQLQAAPALSYCWSPATGLNSTTIANPVTSATEDITYHVYSQVQGTNLIVNGDFSAGNTGFSSSYNFYFSSQDEGAYGIGPNPQAWHPGFTRCSDHTTGNGNMMIINGSPEPDVVVWSQNITVVPNTNYVFSAWIQSLVAGNPAQLQFAINGNVLGNLITASTATCQWTQFYTTWNSGDHTTAVISIVNKNTQVFGNDFALDDISFAQLLMKQDSVRLTIDKPPVRTNKDTIVCIGHTVQLNSTGGQSYSWQPASNLSDATIGNPVATVMGRAEYVVTGTSVNGCTATDTVVLDIHPLPAISKTSDTVICRNTPAPLYIAGGESYEWSPSHLLSDAASANPVAFPQEDQTTFTVQIRDQYECIHTDSVKVTIYPRPPFAAVGQVGVCEGGSITLQASGADAYSWSPTVSLDNPSSPNPVATPAATTTYRVYMQENFCHYDTTLDVRVNVYPIPVVQAKKSNDINCTLLTAQLSATGASTYSWAPSFGMERTDVPNPTVLIDTTTTYVVTGTSQHGCSAQASVEVRVTKDNIPTYAMPNAFTPNHDGRNDCFGIRRWGPVTLLEFSIYNRYGQRVFSTNDPMRCWDGTFNGREQPIGGYAYVIRARTFCGEVKRTGMVMLIR